MADIFPLLLLAVGLSMDAFAVSLCKGLSAKKADFKRFALVAAVFGGLQGIMPLIGYLFGRFFLEYIESYLGIISFSILLVVGAKMIYEGVKGVREKGEPRNGETDEKNSENSQKSEIDGENQENFQADEMTHTQNGENKTEGVNQEKLKNDKTLDENLKNSQKNIENKGFSLKEILVQGVATSIDALAVGVSLLNFSIHIALSASVIAAVTFGICFFGVFLGFKFGGVLKTKDAYADIFGGIILIGIGIGFLF
jgi:putative Mn2+ efflux pump MntP